MASGDEEGRRDASVDDDWNELLADAAADSTGELTSESTSERTVESISEPVVESSLVHLGSGGQGAMDTMAPTAAGLPSVKRGLAPRRTELPPEARETLQRIDDGGLNDTARVAVMSDAHFTAGQGAAAPSPPVPPTPSTAFEPPGKPSPTMIKLDEPSTGLSGTLLILLWVAAIALIVGLVVLL